MKQNKRAAGGDTLFPSSPWPIREADWLLT